MYMYVETKLHTCVTKSSGCQHVHVHVPVHVHAHVHVYILKGMIILLAETTYNIPI